MLRAITSSSVSPSTNSIARIGDSDDDGVTPDGELGASAAPVSVGVHVKSS